MNYFTCRETREADVAVNIWCDIISIEMDRKEL